MQLGRDLGVPARDVVLIIKLQQHLAGPDPKKQYHELHTGSGDNLIVGNPYLEIGLL
jgi:hypothetical protein